VRYGTTGEGHEKIQIECEVMASSEEEAIRAADKMWSLMPEWQKEATVPPAGARRLGYPLREDVISWFKLKGKEWRRIETIALGVRL